MSRRTVARRLLFGLLVVAACAIGTAPREVISSTAATAACW